MSLPEGLRAARPAGSRTIGGAASTWLERHAQSLVGWLGRLARQPFATLLTIAVIGIALALPAALYLLVANMRAVTADLGDTVQLSVYLRIPTTESQAKKVASAIQARVEVERAVLVSPDQGLAEFRAMSGIGEALQALTENPLPLVVKVRPAAPHDTAAAVEALAAMELSDRVIVLNSGRKIVEGPPKEVVVNPEVIRAYLGERYHAVRQ